MTIPEFNDKYNLSSPAIHIAINQGIVPKSVLYKPDNAKALYIDESWFLRRKEFKKKVFNFIHDMYYFHYHGRFSDSFVARECGVSLPMIIDSMWRNKSNEGILSFRLSEATWKVFRHMRLIDRVRYKRYNPNFNVSKELDRIANG